VRKPLAELLLDQVAPGPEERVLDMAWGAGDPTRLPYPDGAIDVVLCQQGLRHVPHPVVALGELRRVLAAEGRLGLAVWRPIRHSPGFAALARTFARHLGTGGAAAVRAAFAGPDAATLCQLLLDAGFAELSLRVGVGTVRVPSAEELLRQLEAGARAALARDLDQTLRDWTGDDGAVVPVQAWLATAHPGPTAAGRTRP
jgi:SAM-dependent methyltransferase